MIDVAVIETLNSYNQLLLDCLDHWGEDMQLNIVIEEMAELTKEICKHKRGDNNYHAVMEETVDVLIMINQLYITAKFPSEEFNTLLIHKLKRISKRLLLEKEGEL